MNAVEFLDFARLIGGPDGPYPQGRKRSAISRSYYAAFLEARDLLFSKAPFTLPKKPKHEQIWRAYLFADPSDLKEIGRLLEDLKKMREAADYVLPEDVSDVDVKEADALSDRIRTALLTADVTQCWDST